MIGETQKSEYCIAKTPEEYFRWTLYLVHPNGQRQYVRAAHTRKEIEQFRDRRVRDVQPLMLNEYDIPLTDWRRVAKPFD